jgi:hypothetical protein
MAKKELVRRAGSLASCGNSQHSYIESAALKWGWREWRAFLPVAAAWAVSPATSFS